MLARHGSVSDIPTGHWREDSPCPDHCLCHAPSRSRVRHLVGEHAAFPGYDHAVYVLECRKRSGAPELAQRVLDVQEPPWWTRTAQNYDRLLYVGLSQRVVHRIYQHAHGTENAASFCTVFPPTRILSIEWYPSLAGSYRAEEETAEQLRERFPDAYVSQPG